MLSLQVIPLLFQREPFLIHKTIAVILPRTRFGAPSSAYSKTKVIWTAFGPAQSNNSTSTYQLILYAHCIQ